MQCGGHDADGGFDAMIAGLNLAKVRQRDDQADRAMAAHAKVADVVEEDHAGDTGFVSGFNDIAPTSTSEPRGSFTTAERKASCWVRNDSSFSAVVRPFNSGPPATTMRVGSPPVWNQ